LARARLVAARLPEHAQDVVALNLLERTGTRLFRDGDFGTLGIDGEVFSAAGIEAVELRAAASAARCSPI
jgi:hypothetical protein